MVKRSTGCKRSPGGQVIVGAKGVRFPDADAILKHIVLGCDLVHQKSRETEAVCFNMVKVILDQISQLLVDNCRNPTIIEL